MSGKWISLGMLSFVLVGCIYPVDYDDDDYRPREHARSECVDEAYDQGYRRVDVQDVQSQRRGDWEIILQGRDRNGRDARLRCDYELRSRRVHVTRMDR